MADEWKRVPLGEVYDTFGGITKGRGAFDEGAALLDVKTIVHSPFVPAQLAARVQATPAELEKYSVRKGDIFLNRTSESARQLGLSCVATHDVPGAVFTGFAKRLRPKARCPLDSFYMAGYLRSSLAREQLAACVPAYTTRASLDERRLRRIWVYYPPRAQQKRIGSALWAIFEKLEHNRLLQQALAREVAMLEAGVHPQDAAAPPVRQMQLGEPERARRARLSGMLQEKQMLAAAQTQALEALWPALIERSITAAARAGVCAGQETYR